MEKTVKIIVATHKRYEMPKDKMYIPLHVGAEGKKDESGNSLDLGYIKDNTGDNISYLNAGFCELTGLYWAWKNLEADYLGLVHYRRYFGSKKKGDAKDRILTYKEALLILKEHNIIVPKKRKYYIETLYSHYGHTHYAEHLIYTRDIIQKICPDYIKTYDTVLSRKEGYMFNMMIMKRGYIDQYCQWLFSILFALNNSIKVPELSQYQGRFYGRISEILFNVWIQYQIDAGHIKLSEIIELPCIYLEKVNWIKKGTAFLSAKFLGKKYKGSF